MKFAISWVPASRCRDRQSKADPVCPKYKYRPALVSFQYQSALMRRRLCSAFFCSEDNEANRHIFRARSLNSPADHTVARSANGTDELSNLQPLCDVCNSRKGNRPDDWWNRTLYFDKPLMTAVLPVSQLDFIYNRVCEFSDFFATSGCFSTYPRRGVNAGNFFAHS